MVKFAIGQEDPLDSRSCWIVLAEDNPADVGLVRHVLREHAVDCELDVISDGEEVLSFINGLDLDSKRCPDLLLLDLHLPKRDGNEVLKHLRASQRCGRMPVVILTSSDANWDRQNAEKKNEAIHHFRKPISLDEFLRLGNIIKDVIHRAPS